MRDLFAAAIAPYRDVSAYRRVMVQEDDFRAELEGLAANLGEPPGASS